jgi:hypothetical protein
MTGRRAVRRRRLLIATAGNRDQVRYVEHVLAEQDKARRERRHYLHKLQEAM